LLSSVFPYARSNLRRFSNQHENKISLRKCSRSLAWPHGRSNRVDARFHLIDFVVIQSEKRPGSLRGHWPPRVFGLDDDEINQMEARIDAVTPAMAKASDREYIFR